MKFDSNKVLYKGRVYMGKFILFDTDRVSVAQWTQIEFQQLNGHRSVYQQLNGHRSVYQLTQLFVFLLTSVSILT